MAWYAVRLRCQRKQASRLSRVAMKMAPRNHVTVTANQLNETALAKLF